MSSFLICQKRIQNYSCIFQRFVNFDFFLEFLKYFINVKNRYANIKMYNNYLNVLQFEKKSRVIRNVPNGL